MVLWLKKSLWQGLRLPPCKSLTFLISQSFDRELSIRERIVLTLHLKICERCNRYLDHLVLMRQIARKKHETDEENPKFSDMSLSPQMRERLKKMLTDSPKGQHLPVKRPGDV
jgi:hypothetical protein